MRIKINKKIWALAGFILSIFRTAVQHANHYTMGSKDFEVKLNEINSSLNYNFFLKLCSLPDTVHCAFRNGHYYFLTIVGEPLATTAFTTMVAKCAEE